jgi:hypothetical protein
MEAKVTELRLIEVPWETRNLGLPAFQLMGKIDNHFVIKSLIENKRIQLNKNFFVQLKIDAEKINEVIYSQEAGFMLVEMTISPYLDLNLVKSKLAGGSLHPLYSLESTYKKNIKNYYCAVDDLQDPIKKEIIDISKKTFSTDRFHMDPYCKNSIANERVGLWLECDLFKDSKNFCSYLMINKSLIGYIIWNQNGFILGGLAQEFIGKGLGKVVYIQSILDVIDAGFEEISTNISVNNVPVLNLYSKLDFSFRKPLYTLHYWSRS